MRKKKEKELPSVTIPPPPSNPIPTGTYPVTITDVEIGVTQTRKDQFIRFRLFPFIPQHVREKERIEPERLLFHTIVLRNYDLVYGIMKTTCKAFAVVTCDEDWEALWARMTKGPIKRSDLLQLFLDRKANAEVGLRILAVSQEESRTGTKIFNVIKNFFPFSIEKEKKA